jgi:hypothetical protein
MRNWTPIPPKNKALITKADKGNTIVTTYQHDYCKKIEDFIGNNNLLILNNDTAKMFLKESEMP